MTKRIKPPVVPADINQDEYSESQRVSWAKDKENSTGVQLYNLSYAINCWLTFTVLIMEHRALYILADFPATDLHCQNRDLKRN